MWTLSYGVLDELTGKFLGNSAYSKSPYLSPELAANVMSLSGLAGILGVAVGSSVGSAQCDLFCHS